MTKLIYAALLAVGASTAHAQELSPTLQEKKEWVKEVEERDYLYWKRVIDRLEVQDEWSPPDSWFAPRVVVEGGDAPYFPSQTTKQTISESALHEAWSYALERNTQALLILHKGQSVAELYAPDHPKGSTVKARSMTKSLMGILFGIAIDEGDIGGLDDPIKIYVSEWADDPRGDLSIRTLLHNTSGLEFPLTAEPGSKASYLLNGTDVDQTALTYELDPTYSGRFMLNNVTTQVLGIALQRATGQPFNSYLSQKLWQPIGAHRALMKQDTIGGRVVTYCCMQGSATDWVRVGQLLLNDGLAPDGARVLPRGWVKTMLEPSEDNPNYGLHIWLGSPFTPLRSYAPPLEMAVANTHSEPFKADDLFYFDGGANTRVWIVPSEDLVIARLGNRPPKALGFDEAFIPNAIIDGIVR
ncbi:MAG: serine hydrolase [Pseudomonadota bacterium]